MLKEMLEEVLKETASDAVIRAAIGQKLVGGFPGPAISPEFIRLVKEYKIGNVILFRHNIVNSRQLKQLCDNIQTLIREETGHGAFITIDQEGGTVTRLPEDCCNVPGAMAVAATGSPDNAGLAAKITAKELKALGINFNLAPSLDINSNPANPVIGVRSYGDTAEAVIAYSNVALDGYREGGILAAVKHFPGHGDTSVDSHIGLPVIDKTWEELENLELKPFRAAIAKGTPAVMTSHILFPRLEPDRIPCTMSRRMITGMLKERLGFDGLVLSDCMEMEAIQTYFGTVQGVIAAMSAGVDLIFISHSQELLAEAAKAAYEAVRSGEIKGAELTASSEKIIGFKNMLDGHEQEAYVRPAKSWADPAGDGGKELQEATDRLRRDSITLVQGAWFPLGDNPLFVGCADYRATLASEQEQEQPAFPVYMKQRLGGTGLITGKNPDNREIDKAVAAARPASAVVLCTYNGHLMPGQMELLHALARLPVPLVAVALRNPYDLAVLPAHVTGICAWDYSEPTLAVMAEVLAGQLIPQGRLPVSLAADHREVRETHEAFPRRIGGTK